MSRRRASAIVERCVREGGIHALHSIHECCRYAVASPKQRQRRAADRTTVRHPQAFGGLNRAHTGELSLALRYGNRTRVTQIPSLVLYPLS